MEEKIMEIGYYKLGYGVWNGWSKLLGLRFWVKNKDVGYFFFGGLVEGWLSCFNLDFFSFKIEDFVFGNFFGFKDFGLLVILIVGVV